MADRGHRAAYVHAGRRDHGRHGRDFHRTYVAPVDEQGGGAALGHALHAHAGDAGAVRQGDAGAHLAVLVEMVVVEDQMPVLHKQRVAAVGAAARHDAALARGTQREVGADREGAVARGRGHVG